MEEGYVQAQSDNLPKVDSFMLINFMSSNPNFVSAEIRGIKTSKSGRESYGDNAIGYVQLKRFDSICIVRGKITPEHKINKKAYSVVLEVDEINNIVKSVKCEDCAAAAGGCKHAIAFLTWVHRRSEDPAKTEIQCYWKKSLLSTVKTSLKLIKAKDLGASNLTDVHPTTSDFLNTFVDYSKESEKTENQLTKYYKSFSNIETLSIHNLFLNFISNKNYDNAKEFLNFCKIKMNESACNDVLTATTEQSFNTLWFELRFGRITASKAYEVSHCKTFDGSLVEQILGAAKMKATAAMSRGITLEKDVLAAVEQKMKLKFHKIGLKLNPDWPILGASPDGISEKYVVEIKCPASAAAFKNYIDADKKITNKYMAQVQLQMFLLQKQNCLFCVADTNFESLNFS